MEEKQGMQEPVELTPEVIAALEDDLRSVIKRCQECGKPIVQKSTLKKYCRECGKKRNLENIKARNMQKYYADHEATCAERREQYAQKRDIIRAQQAKYYASHSEQIKAKVAEYRDKNKEAIAAKKAERYRKNLSPEQKAALKAYQAAYYAKNKERIQAQRKAKKEQAALEKSQTEKEG